MPDEDAIAPPADPDDWSAGLDRSIGFGGAALGLSWDTPSTGGAVELLFADLPAYRGPPPGEALRLETREGPLRFRLLKGTDALWCGRSLAGLTAALLEEAMRTLAARSDAGPVLHAAGVARGRRALAIPGTSGAGKSALCAWLLSRGFGYLTDELTFIEHGSLRLEGLPRPLHVKRPAMEAIRRLLPTGALRHARSTRAGRLIPHRLLNPDFRYETPEIGLFVLPMFDRKSSGWLRPLGRAEASQRLMATVVNARNLDGHGLSEIARLAHRADAFELSYGDFDQLPALLGQLLDERLPAHS